MNTFLFSMFAVGLASLNGVVAGPYLAYYTVFSSMQLIEYFLWSQPANNAFGPRWDWPSCCYNPLLD
jgi:hypothetical protein